MFMDKIILCLRFVSTKMKADESIGKTSLAIIDCLMGIYYIILSAFGCA